MIQVYNPPVRDESLAGSASFKSLFKKQNCWEGVLSNQKHQENWYFNSGFMALWCIFLKNKCLLWLLVLPRWFVYEVFDRKT